jgi:predicted permease
MSPFRAIRHGLRSLFKRADVDRELDDEVAQYLDNATQENMRLGMSRDAAMRAARIAFGGIDAAKEEVRDGGWEAPIETLRQDVRYALRGLRRNPAFTAIAIVTLALGIGANTAMFSVVNAVMLRPLPYRDGNRLAMIWTDDARRDLHREPTAYRTITDWQRETRAFENIAFFTTGRTAVKTNDPVAPRQRTRIALVSANLFSVLGVVPARGRAISIRDEEQRAPVAVISHALWQRHFAGTDDVIGKTLSLDEAGKGDPGPLTIVGVMPPTFYFPDKQVEVWTPATTYWRFTRESQERFFAWARRWQTVGRLAPGASVSDAQNDLARIEKQLTAMHPSSVSDFPGFGTTVAPMLDFFAGKSLQSTLWMLLGAVGLVLLVACANVANLLLARGASRQREFAVRRALGAGRGRLVRQLVAESVVLALIGGALGIAMAALGTRVLATVAAAYVPRVDEIVLDTRVLVFAAIASIAAGLVFGLAPAFRVSAAEAGEILKEGAQATGNLRLHRSRGVLIVAECALATVLLAGAGLLLRSLIRVNAVNPGFDPRHVLTMRVELPPEAPPTAEELTMTSLVAQARARAREQTTDALLGRIQSLPGVEAAGFNDDLFIAGSPNKSITIPGRADSVTAGELNEGSVSPGFFSTMRVPLKRGRYLTRDDAFQKIRALWSLVITDRSLAEKERMATAEPVVVNESFVRQFFPNEDPIGKKFCIDPTNKTYWYQIVGVVGDMHRRGLERSAFPECYGPYIPSPTGRVDLLVRVAGDPLALGPTLRREIAQALPGAMIVSITTAEAGLGGFSAERRFQTWLLMAFASLALVLAAVGIYGVVHYAVAERTREIGVRVALGASPVDVLALVLKQGMRMPAIGIGIGLAVSIGLMRIMTHLLFGVGATDPMTFVGVGFMLAVVAALACYFPARRATRVDPVRALRQE